MAEIKQFFAALKHISPSDLEYYLEKEHSAGHVLKPIGQEGLLYFSFSEEEPKKCAYVVDISALPKAMYVPTLAKKGWEPLGCALNCYVWRKEYEEGKRPEYFADRACLRLHCLRLGFIMLAMALATLALACAYFWFLYKEHQLGLKDHFWQYLIFGIVQLPFSLYFSLAARKLLHEARLFKERLEAGKIISKK